MHFDWRSFLDWVSVISAAGTVLAAGLAAWAIRQSSVQARENSNLVVSERRRDVQIGALQRLGDAIAMPAYNQAQLWQRRRSAEIELALIEASMPVCRIRFSRRSVPEIVAALGLPAGTPDDAIDGATDSSETWTVDRMVDEVVDAIRGQAT